MPKINVYLPDDLAAAVKAAHLSVSPICQRALADAVRAVSTAAQAIESVRAPGFDPAAEPETVARMTALMTPRLQRLIGRAAALGGTPPALLTALVEDPDNLGGRILLGLGVDVSGLSSTDGPPADGLTAAAWLTVADGLEAAMEFGHSYLGSEHLLLGLAGPSGGEAAARLHAVGATAEGIRKAIPAAVAGAALGYKQAGGLIPPTFGDRFDQVTARLAAIEARLGAAGL